MVNPLEHLTGIDLAAWQQLHHQAIGVGCARVIDRDEERAAAPDELIALALIELVTLSALAISVKDIDDPTEPDDTRDELRRLLANTAAGAVRLIDRALSAHGRDVGYRTEVWRDAAIGSGSALATAIATDESAPPHLFQIVAAAADSAALAIREMPRDRLAVPEALSDALAAVLIVFAAAVTIEH